MSVVLYNRNYALLWLGGLISTLGDWVLRGALPFYVYTHTGSALAAGLTFIVSTLPYLCPGSPARPRVRRIYCYSLTPSPGGHRPGQHSRRSARYPTPSRSRLCSLSPCGFGCF